MALQKHRGHFLVSQKFFSDQKKRSSLSINVQNFHFCPKIVVIFKKKVTAFKVNDSYFQPKVKVQTEGHRHGATMKKYNHRLFSIGFLREKPDAATLFAPY